MKKLKRIGILFLMLIASGTLYAQSLEDLLNSEAAKKVLGKVKEVTAFQAKDLEGTWQYRGAASRLKSEDLLQKAGGVALAEAMNTKLDAAYAKVGIVPGKLSYTFAKDSTFTNCIGKKTFKGTYTYDVATGILTLRYYALLPVEATLVRSSQGISLLFNADRLLKIVGLLSGVTKSSALSALGKIASQYDGMLLGFELNR